MYIFDNYYRENPLLKKEKLKAFGCKMRIPGKELQCIRSLYVTPQESPYYKMLVECFEKDGKFLKSKLCLLYEFKQ